MRYSLPLLSVLAVGAASGGVYGAPVNTITPDFYVPQIYSNWCAAASVEMIIDSPTIANSAANPIVKSMLQAPEYYPLPMNAAPPHPVLGVSFGVGYVQQSPQSFIYGLNHGANTVNGLSYSNVNVPFGSGSDSNGVVTALNLLDNPNVNAGTGTAFGNDVFVGYNLPSPVNGAPNMTSATDASRTIADALKLWNVPAQIAVGSGAHSICVYGVQTTPAAPAPGQNYTINGFFVHDPWTGFAQARANVGDFTPAALGGWGLGYNAYLRYGYYTTAAGGQTITLPDGTVVNHARLYSWFRNFNSCPGQPQTGVGTINPSGADFSVSGYKFTVDPQGPESLDTGDPFNDGSLPAPPPLISPVTSSSGALAYAQSDLSTDSALAADLTLNGSGSLGLDQADAMVLTGSNETGDWLVPYDGSGGVNDVIGAVLIDPLTGLIDEATWLDPSENLPNGITLSQLDDMFNDQSIGLTPNNNPTPEPGTMALLAAGGLIAAGRWIVRRRHVLNKLQTRSAD